MAEKYNNIRRTPTFIAAFSEVREHLREASPLAYMALPSALTTILDVIERHPRAWPIKRKRMAGLELEFHLAVLDLAYRRIHLRYYVDKYDVCHLLTVWVDGQDEPRYIDPYQ